MKILVLGAVLVCALLTWFMMSGREVITNYPPKNERIVAFGDSLVAGVGARDGNDLMSQLEKYIGRPITNLGVSGDTTADGVKRIGAVTTLDPGLVIVVLGGNDTLRQTPRETTEANLHMLFDSFIKQGAVVVFLAVRGGIFGSEREDMYERVAHAHGVLYVPDILEGILLKPELMHDGIHPNDAGYARIAERLGKIFKKYDL